MTEKPILICGEHRIPKEWRAATFEYVEDDITIRVPNISAWVCPESGDTSFLPQTVDEQISTVRDLLEAAKRARTRRSMPTEFEILVGQPFELETTRS
ncbi:MAG: hypothetical protein PVH17_00555 [Anaerolineae bacterium]|jgi:hypothetical protein